MRRQDRGDVGDDLSSKMEELRMDASSKGIAWLQKEVDSMGRALCVKAFVCKSVCV